MISRVQRRSVQYLIKISISQIWKKEDEKGKGKDPTYNIASVAIANVEAG